MYLTHTLDERQQPVFVLVLPFEQKHLARQYGFTWNHPQPGGWGTKNILEACEAIKQNPTVPPSVDPATLDYIKANTAMTDTTYDRLRAMYAAPTRKEQAAIYAATMSDEQVLCVHQGLQQLAAVCDGARADDGAGFNRNDLEYGHSLAAAPTLSRSQAGYGKALLKKYSGQLGEELYSVIFPELVEAAQETARMKEQNKARKAAPKAHKLNKACDWLACPEEACTRHRRQEAERQATVMVPVPCPDERADCAVVHKKAIELPASSADPVPTEAAAVSRTPVGVTEPDGSVTVTRPESVVVVTGLDDDGKAAEIARLARLLADCHPGDFDTTVDMLRDLREIDAPKQAGSEFIKQAYTATGYRTA